jgi:NAD-dependent deacetylase
MEEIISKVKEKLYSSNIVVSLTGSGISAESGVPTFRGKNGLWKNHRAEELATPSAFRRNPRLVWEWYSWRRNLIDRVDCNPAHLALAELERRIKDFVLITQNVDGLHKKGGSKNILEFHGNIWEVRCTRCGKISENHEIPIEILPYCNDCKGLLRPNVVWFGEELPQDIFRKSIEIIMKCEFMFVIGTSGVVQPAASLAFKAKENGAFICEINIEKTPISPIADEIILGEAGNILPKFL